MSLTALSLFKKQVMADDLTCDDDLLQQKLDAAEAYCIAYTHRSISELLELGGGAALPLPVTQAVLLVGADWYDHREDSTTPEARPIPHGAIALLKPWRKLVNTEDPEKLLGSLYTLASSNESSSSS